MLPDKELLGGMWIDQMKEQEQLQSQQGLDAC